MTLTPDGTKINSRPLAYKTVINADADDDASSVTQTNDGFIVAGSSDNLSHLDDLASINHKRDALMERVNDDLTTYSGSWADPPAYGQGSANVATRIFQQPDNRFYVFGYAKYQQRGLGGGPKNDFDFWYFGLGPTGVPLPPNTFGSNADEKLKSVVVLPSGGFFLGGVVTDQGNDDVYFTSLRSQLSFDSTDSNFAPAPLGYNLGALKNELVSVFPSQTSGYFILSNENSTGNSNLFLMKIGPRGKRDVWASPVIFGGQGDDFAGAVRELPNGKIVVFGTMSIGQPNGEDKMVLIKVNKDGQFAN
jgi:hypothetical protein